MKTFRQKAINYCRKAQWIEIESRFANSGPGFNSCIGVFIFLDDVATRFINSPHCLEWKSVDSAKVD